MRNYLSAPLNWDCNKMTENKKIMKQARDALRNHWGTAILTGIIWLVILEAVGLCVPFFGGIANLLLAGPLLAGYFSFNLTLGRKKHATLEQLFSKFENWSNTTGTYLLTLLFTLLWSMLFIIPGIIASIRYSQAMFIVADNAKITPMQAIEKSKKMMQGNKWKFFCLNFRFIGWALLCLLTLGIGFLWLMPYQYVSLAKFYDDIK